VALYKKGAMTQRFQIRTSNDNSVWTSYAGPDDIPNTYYTNPGQQLNASKTRYLQYKTYIDRSTSSDIPKLYNVGIAYEILSGVSVSLTSPPNKILIIF